jgi:hypothetical protein
LDMVGGKFILIIMILMISMDLLTLYLHHTQKVMKLHASFSTLMVTTPIRLFRLKHFTKK